MKFIEIINQYIELNRLEELYRTVDHFEITWVSFEMICILNEGGESLFSMDIINDLIDVNVLCEVIPFCYYAGPRWLDFYEYLDRFLSEG